jgi:hypothetical protein
MASLTPSQVKKGYSTKLTLYDIYIYGIFPLPNCKMHFEKYY